MVCFTALVSTIFPHPFAPTSPPCADPQTLPSTRISNNAVTYQRSGSGDGREWGKVVSVPEHSMLVPPTASGAVRGDDFPPMLPRSDSGDSEGTLNREWRRASSQHGGILRTRPGPGDRDACT